MIQNTFTINGEIKHKLRRKHSIYLNNEQWEKLKEYAQSKNISISELILKMMEKREYITTLK